MIKWAGWIITLCGVGHTVGALALTIPRYAEGWLTWALWDEQNRSLVEMSPTAAAFWFSAYSFGVPLLLIGLTVLWAARHNLTPPAFIAPALAIWAVVGTILTGRTPMLLLLPAAVLLLIAARRAKHHPSFMPGSVLQQADQ